MIKGVSQLILRNTALGLFMAGSMSVAAANLHKNNSYVTEPNKTELISKAGAEALKVNSIQVVNQSGVPAVHNQKLDATLKKLSIDENDKNSINGLVDKIYDVRGTFLGTVFVQHELNKRALYTFMTGNTKLLRDSGVAPEFADKIDSYGEDFYKTVKPNAETVINWAVGTYTPYLVSKLKFDHKPTADEVLDKLDDIIENESILTKDEKQRILVMSDNYKRLALQNKKDAKSLSDAIAYKVNMYDTYMFFRELVNAGIYDNGYYRRSNKTIKDFYNEWMINVSPIEFNKK